MVFFGIFVIFEDIPRIADGHIFQLHFIVEVDVDIVTE